MQAERVFQFVVEEFHKMGAACPHLVTRTTLLQDGLFIGERFRCGNLQAVWLAEGSRVEFYGAHGELLGTAALASEQAARKAA